MGQSLRKYADQQGQPDFKLEKFAINSVLSATHTAEMPPNDQNDIIKKVKSSGQGDDQAEVPAEPATEPQDEVPAETAPEAPAETDEQTLVEMSLNDVNSQKLIDLYNRGGEARKIIVRLVTLSDNYDDAKGFVEALQDHVDYEDLNYIYSKLKELGVQIPNDVEPEMAPVHEDSLYNSEKLRIFEDKTIIMTTTEPVVKPTTKPDKVSPTTPERVEPSRRDRPFLPNVTPGVNPDPKAEA